MWMMAVMAASAVIGEIGKAKQKRAHNKQIQKQVDNNYEAANKNIKQIEKKARSAAQTQQSDVAMARVAEAEASSAAKLGSGIEGQSVDLYNEKVARDMEQQLGQAGYNFEKFNEGILAQADEVAYNTNMQNEGLVAGAATTSGLDVIGAGLNIASAYQSGLNMQTNNALKQQQLDSALIGTNKGV